MMGIGALGFLSPAVLLGLLAIPVLWWLLRAIPPSPKVEVFPGVRLLLGLEDPERQAAKTPWWLLLLRAVMVAAVILGFAQPVLNPSDRLTEGRAGPVLILIDQGWASAPDWTERVAIASAALDEAAQAGRQVVLWLGAGEGAASVPPVVAPGAARPVLEGARPQPVPADHAGILAALEGGALPAVSETIWLHDGIAYDEATGALADLLVDRADLRLIGPEIAALGLSAPALVDGRMRVEVLRAGTAGAGEAGVVALAVTPDGPERRIAVAPAAFEAGEDTAEAIFDLPPELIGQVSRVVLAERASAGGAALADAAIRRVPVAVVDPATEGHVATLTNARRYLVEGLEPWADVAEVPLADAIAREPSAIFLADQGALAPAERDALMAWVEAGGLLVRFAGPRLAAAIGEPVPGAVAGDDPLLPVRLRRGGRVLGGALAWGAPRTLGPFDPQGPFRRLTPPAEVSVKTQVLAEPTPDLAGRVWATLDDGTPLVTAAERGEGRIVLFHVSADPEWSSLPLSGLFVEMLGRLSSLAPGQGAALPSADELQGTQWRVERVMGPEGEPLTPPDGLDPVAGEMLADGRAGRGLMPGLYARADAGPRAAGAAENLVLNLHQRGDTIAPMPPAPPGAVAETMGGAETVRLAAPLLMLAILLAAIDTVATLWLSGRLAGLSGRARRGAAAAAVVVVAMGTLPGEAIAQERPDTDTREISIAAETTLGFIVTGDQRIDRLSERAMVGLGEQLTRRTAVEPGPPAGVDPERDELGLLPVIYWPLTGSTAPTDLALERLARYIANGGMLIIDTQNGSAGFGAASAAEMRQIARALNLPPLAPVDGDHVLSRSFYLLNDFPGRWRGGRVWAEAPPQGANGAAAESDFPSFDRVDDNVSPVIVGSADWAAAWAVDEDGRALVPVGRPGDRQREMAVRFGVNVVMYALTGNYKSDQVHAPAVLERLGQ